MKKLLLVIAVACMSLTCSAQLGKLGIFNHLGVGVHVATTGAGFELATPITPWIQARVGMSFMPGIHYDTSVDVYNRTVNGEDNMRHEDMDVTASLKRVQTSVIFNIYPFGKLNSFYVAGGFYAGGRSLIKITGYNPDFRELGSEVAIGDYRVPIDPEGYVRGGIRVKSFRPYLGIGYGRPVPNRRLNFSTEIGVQFHGKPEVYTDYGYIDLSNVNEADDFQKIIDKVKVYPVIKFTLSGRIF